MSSKYCSLAIEEDKEDNHEKDYAVGFEPALQVLVHQRDFTYPDSKKEHEKIHVRGKITISF